MCPPSAAIGMAAIDRSGEISADACAESIRQAADILIENVEKVIVGKRETIELVAVALFTEGHVLIEDVPGVGKTLLAKAIARSLDGSFRRIQFTPDLLPSDVTGINTYNRQTEAFQFLAGPIMANIVLADEINRATPRTQASLLEAMEERQVTTDGETRPLPRPFLVLATQNPIEQEGTFPLPEAQRDRFLLTVTPGYPSAEDEERILLRFERTNPADSLSSIMSAAELTTTIGLCRYIRVGDAVRAYLVALVRATRGHPDIRLGASPRATQSLYRAVQALAAMRGRAFVLPDDVKALAVPVLAHRLVAGARSRLGGRTAADVLADLMETVPVPVE
ncbi:AAA family ATPase [Shumkonia mesophila]|uniref:AAA family ATPase n=1 Tax=Shumkonia mesophila TaxID=2838854 RepID=UPI0029341062|nr:MoxR family ATPase [Shumkonia mesophila]